MIEELVAVGYLVGDYIYHRIHDRPQATKVSRFISLPNGGEGSVIPLVYGRVRVKQPLMAWWGVATDVAGSSFGVTAATLYGVDMFFNVGVGFQGGSAHLYHIYVGEYQLGEGPPGLASQSGAGDGGGGTSTPMDNSVAAGNDFIGGIVEFLDGRSTQTMVDPIALTATTQIGQRMLDDLTIGDGAQIPGYRGYISVGLYNNVTSWIIGANPQPGAYSFEVASYPAGFGSGLIGDDVNPIDVLYDIFFGTFGKLGLDPVQRIDNVSWDAAAAILKEEGHGFSRAWEDGASARDRVNEILAQVDGVLYEDPPTGKIKIKLVRADYDVDTLRVINPQNCVELQAFTATGWTQIPNKVIVTFTDRSNQYRDGTAVAINQANAVGQDGEVRTVTLNMPGITTQAVADEVAARELQALSRPQVRLSAIVNREFLRITQGDVVLLTWPEANISRMVCRVANVSHGLLDNNKIKLDLIQDSFYQWRKLTPASHGALAFPGPPPSATLGP